MEVNIKKSTGASGNAMVRRLKNNIVVAFGGGDTYEIDDLTQLPAKFENGEYNVALSADGTKIFGLRPVGPASYVMDFKELGNKTNGIPDTKLQRGGKLITMDNGQKFLTKDQLLWYVTLTVMAPGHRFDGLEVRHQLPFIFVNAPGSNSVMMSGTKKEIERTELFLRSFGMDISSVNLSYGPHPHILAQIESYLLEHKRPAYVTLNEKGYVDSVSTLPDQLLPTTPKKRAKKHAE